jgi:hypothetical protein
MEKSVTAGQRRFLQTFTFTGAVADAIHILRENSVKKEKGVTTKTP